MLYEISVFSVISVVSFPLRLAHVIMGSAPPPQARWRSESARLLIAHSLLAISHCLLPTAHCLLPPHSRALAEHFHPRVAVQVAVHDLAVVLAEFQAIDPQLFIFAVRKP